jgi:hypothetical protein
MQQLPNKQASIRPRIAVSVVVFATFAALMWFAVRANVAEEELKRIADEKKSQQRAAQTAAQANPGDWLTVGKEKEISQTEKIRLLQVNSSVMGLFSTECLLYTNAEYKTSQLVCSNGIHGQ